MERKLLDTTALGGFLPPPSHPVRLGDYGVWRDIERTTLAMPGDTVACVEIEGPLPPFSTESFSLNELACFIHPHRAGVTP